jgi:hypothetical protein
VLFEIAIAIAIEIGPIGETFDNDPDPDPDPDFDLERSRSCCTAKKIGPSRISTPTLVSLGSAWCGRPAAR